jgi:WD40 repeat protein
MHFFCEIQNGWPPSSAWGSLCRSTLVRNRLPVNIFYQITSQEILSVSLLFFSSKDLTVRLWSLEYNRCIAVCRGHTESITAAAISKMASSTLFAISSGRDRTLKKVEEKRTFFVICY